MQIAQALKKQARNATQIAQERKKRHSAQRKLRNCATCAISATCETCKLFCATPTSGDWGGRNEFWGAREVY